CRLSSALTGRAYSAAGQAATALHAMATLQVYQAKALKELHKGSPDQAVMQELRAATDFALRATKVTARSLGQVMSTFVVQERHLWLNLAQMADVDKARFLNAPVSQAGLFGDTVEDFAQQFSAVQKQTEAIKHILPRHETPRKSPGGPGPSVCSAAVDLWVGGTHPLTERAIFHISGPSAPGSVPERQDVSSGSDSEPTFANAGTWEEGECCPVRPDCSPGRSSFWDQSPFPSRRLPHRGHVGQRSADPTGGQADGLARAAQPVWWLIRTVRLGYAIQFARRPPKFRGILFTSVCSDTDASVLRAEIAVLLAKDTIEPVPPAEMKSGFYSPYFIVPKKSGRLQPILDLRVLNRSLLRLPFKMLTSKRILSCIRHQDWFAAIDLKDAYFHVSILPRHSPFLRFAFEGRAYQYKVLPFGLSLSPRVFTKVAEGALNPLWRRGIRILNYLDDWLIMAHSRDLLCEHRDLVLQHLSHLGLRVRCLHHGLGCCMQRASSLGLLDRTSTALAHQLPGVASSASRAALLSSDAPPQAHACPHGQHCDRSVHQPSGWSTLPSYVATRPPSAPVESDAAEIAARRSHTSGAQPCSRSALTAAHPPWRMATPPPDSPAHLELIRRGPDRSVCLPRILPLPALLLPHRGSPRQEPQLASGAQVRLSPSEPPCTDPVQDQRGWGAGSAGCAVLAHPNLICRPHAPPDSPSLEDPLEEGPSFSGDGHYLAPASRSMEPACVASGQDTLDLAGLPQAVVETITQSRAPSTRQAYALRWGLFVDWCASRGEDPQRCPIAVVLSFLQEKLERRLSPSTLKVYVAAIAAYHDAVDGESIGKHQLVVRFLKGARRVNPPRPQIVPSWDLSIALRGLRGPPFEPLVSVELKFLSLKVSTTPFRDQVVNLQALPPEEADPALALLCPVRALRVYVDRTRSFRRSEQLFVCFGGQHKGNAVSKQRLAHWVVDAISLAYESQGEPCPLGVRAHSTRSVASSYALAHGASLADICRAAGWATPNTFARFYNLRVEPVSSRVL
ncbi:hypothetical protein M9458_057582, partial [Cirrhinus mrigala]